MFLLPCRAKVASFTIAARPETSNLTVRKGRANAIIIGRLVIRDWKMKWGEIGGWQRLVSVSPCRTPRKGCSNINGLEQNPRPYLHGFQIQQVSTRTKLLISLIQLISNDETLWSLITLQFQWFAGRQEKLITPIQLRAGLTLITMLTVLLTKPPVMTASYTATTSCLPASLLNPFLVIVLLDIFTWSLEQNYY